MSGGAEDTSRWMTIYPLYLSADVKRKDGRRVPNDKAVKDPTCEEILGLLKYLKFQAVIEQDKKRPADYWTEGRVRVKFRGADKQPLVPEFATKQQLLLKLGELIPELASRKGGSASAADCDNVDD